VSEDKPLNELNATEIAAGVAQGRFTGEAVTTACLEHIAKREPVLGAWAWLDPRRAQAQARAPVAEVEAGPLFGVPVGIKDVFDTLDAPTQMGSPIYAQHQPPGDAAAVACLRAAGAVILGKTVTCEFAGMTPGKTTNPHDPARTPGGSVCPWRSAPRPGDRSSGRQASAASSGSNRASVRSAEPV
jgi:amidase